LFSITILLIFVLFNVTLFTLNLSLFTIDVIIDESSLSITAFVTITYACVIVIIGFITNASTSIM